MRMSWPTLLLGLFLATPAAAQEKPELAKVRLAVGGQAALYYLPLVVTQRLGLFREAGVEVDISDFAGGSRALQALSVKAVCRRQVQMRAYARGPS